MESLNDTAPIVEEMDEDSFIVKTSEMKGEDNNMRNSNFSSQAPDGSNGIMPRSISAIKKGSEGEKIISMRKSPFYQKQRSKGNQLSSSFLKSGAKKSSVSNAQSDHDE